MGIIAWILVGLVAGWLASLVMRTNDSQGMFADIVLGVLGGLVGGFLMNLLGFEGTSGVNIYSILVATLGAILLFAAGRALRVNMR